jgi:hypothetical protein
MIQRWVYEIAWIFDDCFFSPGSGQRQQFSLYLSSHLSFSEPPGPKVFDPGFWIARCRLKTSGQLQSCEGRILLG